MAKWVHADVLDNGIAYIKANCNKMALVSSYSAGDSYATVNAAIVAEAVMAMELPQRVALTTSTLAPGAGLTVTAMELDVTLP